MNAVDHERLDVARTAVTRLVEGIRTIHNEPRNREDARILALFEEASSSLEAAEAHPREEGEVTPMRSRHLFALTDAERRLLLRKLEPSSMDTKIESRLAKALRERLFGSTPEFTEGEIERVAYCAGDLLSGDPSAVVQHLGKHGETHGARRARQAQKVVRMTHPTQPEHVYLSGLSGLGVIRFTAVVKHGKGTREVAVNVAPEEIIRIADALRATAPKDGACPCDSKNGKYDSHEKFLVSHAVWHVEHPSEPMPCIDRGAVIEATSREQGRLVAAPGEFRSITLSAEESETWRSSGEASSPSQPGRAEMSVSIGGPGEETSVQWASSETVAGSWNLPSRPGIDVARETRLASSETIHMRRRRRHAIEGVLLDAGLNFDDEQHEALCNAFMLALEAL